MWYPLYPDYTPFTLDITIRSLCPIHMIQHCQKVWRIHWKIFLKKFIVDVLIILTATAEKMTTADSS